MSTLRKALGLGTAVGLVVGLVALVVIGGSAPPDGPVDIAWDREPCAECRMHVGEPAFAAQLQTRDGRILNFDDPGCALRYVAREVPAVHELYFHHHKEDTWLTRTRTAFVPASPTPMGYGLAATLRGTAGALSFEAATAQVLRAEPLGTR